jgi:translocator protein
MNRKWIELAAFLLLVAGGGLLVGFFSTPGEWYASLNKPWFNPPNWLFGPAWTFLYILIAIAGWRIWRKDPNGAAMKIWWVSLGLNFLWSPVFFGAQQIGLGLVVVLAMLTSIIAFIFRARQVDRSSSLLFMPYAAWVSFATLLNASIWWLN